MKKSLSGMTRITHVPAFDELVIPDSIADVLFPRMACADAERLVGAFERPEPVTLREVFDLLFHLTADEEPHGDACPYRRPDREALLRRLRQWMNIPQDED